MEAGGVTVIAAVVAESGACIACDSFGMDDGGVVDDHGTKLVKVSDDIVVGCAGSYLLITWWERFGRKLWKTAAEDGDAFCMQDWIEDTWQEWIKWARNAGHGKLADDGALLVPGTCIVVTPGLTTCCQGDGAVLRIQRFTAIGSGGELALGSLYTSRDDGKSPVARVAGAVLAAIALHGACGGDVHVMSVGDPK